MKDAQDLKNLLADYYGTEQYYRHGLNRNMLYTDGVQAFAENAGNGAYWFLDIAATEVWELAMGGQDFIHIELSSANDEAVITADDGNGTILWTRNIDYTDCPAGKWRFYLTDSVLLLTSEY